MRPTSIYKKDAAAANRAVWVHTQWTHLVEVRETLAPNAMRMEVSHREENTRQDGTAKAREVNQERNRLTSVQHVPPFFHLEKKIL